MCIRPRGPDAPGGGGGGTGSVVSKRVSFSLDFRDPLHSSMGPRVEIGLQVGAPVIRKSSVGRTKPRMYSIPRKFATATPQGQARGYSGGGGVALSPAVALAPVAPPWLRPRHQWYFHESPVTLPMGYKRKRDKIGQTLYGCMRRSDLRAWGGKAEICKWQQSL